MKINKYIIAGGLLTTFAINACTDLFEEESKATYTPEYFKTEQGVLDGVNSMYAHLRYIYGPGYYYNICETGTDEYTYAQSADNNFKDADMSGVGQLTASSSRSDALWAESFLNINTANGIIENGEEAGIDTTLLAEARFFRAFDYFNLVQTFGGVPLDLGSGELKQNTSTSRTSVRNTVPVVYTKCILPDLEKAAAQLPDVSRSTGTATKTVAILFLSKAYLTYAWWLENPGNIPTYPACNRTDPNGHDAAYYYQKAYDLACYAIDNPSGYGLVNTFYDVNVASNDRNKEILLYADHTESSEYYNGGSLSYGSGAAPDNFACWMVTWNYTETKLQNSKEESIAALNREACQGYGRPWTRMAPTINVFEEIFTDKTNDSRFDGTFQLVLRGNWDKAGKTDVELYAGKDKIGTLPIKNGEPVLSFIEDVPEIVYPEAGQGGENGVGAGVISGRADLVIGYQGISRKAYPTLWKISGQRNDYKTGLGSPNSGSTRPFPIAKFSEFYLIAAEAAVKGATGSKSAVDLVNVLRARAGKWSFSISENKSVDFDYSDQMTAATPAVIDIDYILEERGREFYGEGYRWFDLVRTQSWKAKASTYKICGDKAGDHTPMTFTRTIEDYNYLRPIPQGQLDALEMSDSEKAAYQNPGY